MSTKRNVVPEDVIVTSVRLNRADHAALKALAARERRSMAQQIRHMVESAVADDKATKAAA